LTICSQRLSHRCRTMSDRLSAGFLKFIPLSLKLRAGSDHELPTSVSWTKMRGRSPDLAACVFQRRPFLDHGSAKTEALIPVSSRAVRQVVRRANGVTVALAWCLGLSLFSYVLPFITPFSTWPDHHPVVTFVAKISSLSATLGGASSQVQWAGAPRLRVRMLTFRGARSKQRLGTRWHHSAIVGGYGCA
jgi:hypothetical protein